MCYNKNVLAYYKNKVCPNSSLKTDASTQTDFSDNHDCSRKQDSCGKPVSTRKQDGSNKEDSPNERNILINFITDVDPDLLYESLRETLSKTVMLESDYTMAKMILDELLRVRCIPRKQYIAVC